MILKVVIFALFDYGSAVLAPLSSKYLEEINSIFYRAIKSIFNLKGNIWKQLLLKSFGTDLIQEQRISEAPDH